MTQAAVQETPGWIEVGSIEDIPKLGSRVVKQATGDIALFRTSDDEVFALHNRCPHKGGPLSEGIVYGQTVSCPLHNWCLDLASGQVKAPDEGSVPTYPARIVDGRVLLSLVPNSVC